MWHEREEKPHQHKKENRAKQHNQRQNRRVADAADLPFLSPTFQRAVQRPPQETKAGDRNDQKEEDALVNMVQDVVAHLMPHHRLNLFRRAAP